MRQSQVARAENTPRLLQSVVAAMKIPDLRNKLLFVFAMLAIFRFLAQVPVPGVEREALANFFRDNELFGFLDVFSGGALRSLSVVALGVFPYITSSIIMQLMVPVFPQLKEISKEGESGRQRINQLTHWLMIPIAAVQGFGQLTVLQRGGAISGVGLTGDNLLPTVAILASLIAGTTLLVWMGELITEKGIGNGISIIIFGGIVATLPQMVGQGFLERDNAAGLILLGVLGLIMIYFIVVFGEAERRIPVQYGRSVFRGGRMYRQGGSSHIPIRVNSAGMIPLIFAFSIMMFPSIAASYFVNPASTAFLSKAAAFVQNLFDPANFVYYIFTFILVVIFTFFYAILMFRQQNLAESLQRNGGFIPGIRPGQATDEYLNRLIMRITWGGAIFLGLIAVLPFIITQITEIRALQLPAISLLIMVGVALDAMRQLEAQLMMRNYEGFIR
ncbi:MAG: preprotein translocase subunit SecY [Chloroflexi bacterium]|nr:preprotein translocase subunit SecY [Chloroflexota bacterium]MQF99598.1 preprotein translocase subunit SecY [SAR202 cluster bacterium]|tara:strand:- start:2307 stop:3644 length:1338 start_codon:yes stop_codon:yes gene_type:complete